MSPPPSATGRDCAPADLERFLDAYVPTLAEELPRRGATLLPGVGELLAALAPRDVVLGLGTGNFRRAAETKLAPLGIWDYFVEGGYGDDSPNRTALLAAGLDRLRAHTTPDAEVVVIGDTSHDIEAGRAIGARIVAVRTGYAEDGDLDTADVVLDDFSNLAQSLKALLDS